MYNRKPTYVQEEVYQYLHDLSRFYQNMNEDLVRAKNRLHKVLQVTFPELENLLSTPTGEQYWNLLMAFPCKEFVLSLSQSNLCKIIHQSTSKRISEKRIAYLTDKLVELANRSYCAVKKTSPMMEEVRYYAQELLRLVTPILVISQISMRNEKGNRLIRTMYYLITHNKLYDYDSTQNQ